MTIQKLFIVSLLLLLPFQAWAACGGSSPNLTAASCALADVDACITVAVDGDTINIPACAQTDWAGAIVVPSTKGLKIKGAGSGNTIIRSTVSYEIFHVDIDAKTTELSDMTIRASLHPDNAVVVFHQNGGEMVNAFRLHHITFDSFVDTSRVILVWGTQIFGVIDSNTFTANSGSIQAIKVGILSDYATAAWAAAIPQGTNKNVFVENNTFTNITTSVAQPALDADQGASVVFRYNNTTNSGIHVHGYDSTTNGTKWLEIYNNAFGGTMDQAVYIRGGSAVIKGNSIAAGYGNPILLRYYRACCGISNLPDECGSFTNCPNLDPEICLAEAKRCNGSNANDNNDDATGYICRQQPGTAIYTAGEYVSTPIYQWSNTWSGAVTIGISGVGGCIGYQENHMQVNRDWFNAEKSGYTSYTCPHPLTGLTGTCGSGAGTGYYNLGGGGGATIGTGAAFKVGTGAAMTIQ